MAVPVEADSLLLEEKVHHGSLVSRDVDPWWKWLAGGVRDQKILCFHVHGQGFEPGKLVWLEDGARPRDDLVRLGSHVSGVVLRGEGDVGVVVAAGAGDVALAERVDARARGAAVSDHIAAAIDLLH